MNELMITFDSVGWLYFKTSKDTASKAFDDFCELCEQMGINIDNMVVKELVLRNSEMDDVDSVGGKEAMS